TTADSSTTTTTTSDSSTTTTATTDATTAGTTSDSSTTTTPDAPVTTTVTLTSDWLTTTTTTTDAPVATTVTLTSDSSTTTAATTDATTAGTSTTTTTTFSNRPATTDVVQSTIPTIESVQPTPVYTPLMCNGVDLPPVTSPTNNLNVVVAAYASASGIRCLSSCSIDIDRANSLYCTLKSFCPFISSNAPTNQVNWAAFGIPKQAKTAVPTVISSVIQTSVLRSAVSFDFANALTVEVPVSIVPGSQIVVNGGTFQSSSVPTQVYGVFQSSLVLFDSVEGGGYVDYTGKLATSFIDSKTAAFTVTVPPSVAGIWYVFDFDAAGQALTVSLNSGTTVMGSVVISLRSSNRRAVTSADVILTQVSAPISSQSSTANSQVSASSSVRLFGSVFPIDAPALELSNRQLSGLIPSEVTKLVQLQTLKLDHNKLVGSIPPQLGTLLELSILDLSNNTALTGSIPTEVALLTSLQSLSISSNLPVQDIDIVPGSVANNTVILNVQSFATATKLLTKINKVLVQSSFDPLDMPTNVIGQPLGAPSLVSDVITVNNTNSNLTSIGVVSPSANNPSDTIVLGVSSQFQVIVLQNQSITVEPVDFSDIKIIAVCLEISSKDFSVATKPLYCNPLPKVISAFECVATSLDQGNITITYQLNSEEVSLSHLIFISERDITITAYANDTAIATTQFSILSTSKRDPAPSSKAKLTYYSLQIAQATAVLASKTAEALNPEHIPDTQRNAPSSSSLPAVLPPQNAPVVQAPQNSIINGIGGFISENAGKPHMQTQPANGSASANGGTSSVGGEANSQVNNNVGPTNAGTAVNSNNTPINDKPNLETLGSHGPPVNALKPQSVTGPGPDFSSILPSFVGTVSVTVVETVFSIAPGKIQAVDGGSLQSRKRDAVSGGVAAVILKVPGVKLGSPIVSTNTNIKTTNVANGVAFSFNVGTGGVWYEFYMPNSGGHLVVGVYTGVQFLGTLDYPVAGGGTSSTINLSFVQGLVRVDTSHSLPPCTDAENKNTTDNKYPTSSDNNDSSGRDGKLNGWYWVLIGFGIAVAATAFASWRISSTLKKKPATPLAKEFIVSTFD
ncbi:UNVERIFIED_CONTAM: hypothetical protein HDU68_011307, partial [Siphonaria sp. JEL0065]